MKKVGLVCPWYGEKITGGAEANLRGIAHNMQKRGIDVEVLTTCVKDANSDFNANVHPQGCSIEAGITVRRFQSDVSDLGAFVYVNHKLCGGQKVISYDEEKTFVEQNINSQELYRYIREHEKEYSAFLFSPYLFGTTYYGAQQVLKKAILIPCFHDEPYVYLRNFRRVYSNVAGMAFNAQPEQWIAEKLYDLHNVHTMVTGCGLDTNLQYDAQRFRMKYQINDPFILYAGRKNAGKNVDTLLHYFSIYKRKDTRNLKLVLIGGGQIAIPSEIKDDVIDLGFVPIQDKYDAYGAAELLCQPSKHESFSLVIMESWLCDRPVLVSGDCAVTKNFAVQSGGGLYFTNYCEFAGALDYYKDHPDMSEKMAAAGKAYVKENFDWDRVIEKYVTLIEEISE